jgi:hypothetical protein
MRTTDDKRIGFLAGKLFSLKAVGLLLGYFGCSLRINYYFDSEVG